jgi:hypothetical protein
MGAIFSIFRRDRVDTNNAQARPPRQALAGEANYRALFDDIQPIGPTQRFRQALLPRPQPAQPRPVQPQPMQPQPVQIQPVQIQPMQIQP